MENNRENLDWATAQLMKLSWMRGFPSNDATSLADRARRFLKVVHNKSIIEIKRWEFEQSSEFKYQHKPYVFNAERLLPEFVSEDRNDVDWLLDKIGETLDRFPTQAGIRRIYQQWIRPYDGLKVDDEETR